MDLDFATDLTEGFQIDVGTNPQGVSGNRALVNQFEIVFLTTSRQYLMSQYDPTSQTSADTIVIDTFGGNADKFLSVPNAVNDLSSITAAVNSALDQTIKSIKDMQNSLPGISNTEKLSSARMNTLTVVLDQVFAVIEIIPMQYETYQTLSLNLPILRT